MRRVAALLLALLGLVASGGLARAQQGQGPAVEIRQLGWQGDGSFAPAAWNPVLLHVGGSATNDTLRVQLVLRYGAGPSARPQFYPLGAYGQEIALPPGVEKDVRLWIYIPASGTFGSTAQLLTSSGQVLAEQSAQSQASFSSVPLVATLAESPTLAAQLGQVEVPFQQGLTAQLQTVSIAPSDMPARADYLRAFRALIVQGTAPASLNGEQRRAIQDWVLDGGDLVVLGGPDASRAASVLDGSSAPALHFGTLDPSTDLTPLAAWAAPNAQLGPGPAARVDSTSGAGETLAAAGDRILAQRAPWGDGTLTLVAADSTLDPLRGFSATPALLRRALEPALVVARAPGPGRQAPDPTPDDSRLVSALDALPPQVFPDWREVGLLLFGFALIAGPVLHLLLWRADRRPFLWVAVPALSIAFTLALYVLAGAGPGKDVVASAVTEVRLDPHSNDARQTVALGFFAPLRDRLSVQSADELPVRVWSSGVAALQQTYPGSFSGSLSGMFGSPTSDIATEPPYRVISGRDTRVEFAPNAGTQGGLRSMVFTRSLPGIGHLEADLHIEGSDGLIRGTVRNATQYPLDEVGLGVGLTLLKLGPLAPGQTVPVSFDPRTPAPTTQANIAYSLAWQMYGAPDTPSRSPTAGRYKMPEDPEQRRRMRLLDTVLARSGGGQLNQYNFSSQPYQQVAPTAPLLVAVTSAPIGEDTLPNAGAQRTFELTVFDEPLSLLVAPGPFKLLPVLLPPIVVTDPGATLSNNTYQAGLSSPNWIDLRGGTATYTFHADLPPGSRVDSLGVRTTQSSTQILTSPAVPSVGPGLASLNRGPDNPSPGTAGTFSAFNWQSSRWEQLTPGSTQTTIDNAVAYVSQNGVVRIQVNSGGKDRTVRYQAPELTMVGEVTP
jgi:hypothetical protein